MSNGLDAGATFLLHVNVGLALLQLVAAHADLALVPTALYVYCIVSIVSCSISK